MTLPEIPQAGTDNPVPVQAKESKPRVKRVVQLSLPKPTNVDGSADTSLGTATEKKFLSIAYYEGKKIHAVVHTSEKGKKTDAVGTAITNFTYAILNAALAGIGISPDGSAIYAAEHYKDILKAYPKFGTYTLVAVPAGRSGLKAYTGTVDAWMKVVKARADIMVQSKKASGTQAHVVREKKAESHEKVTVHF